MKPREVSIDALLCFPLFTCLRLSLGCSRSFTNTEISTYDPESVFKHIPHPNA